MTVVDTSVFIDYFRGISNQQTKSLDHILKTDIVILGDLVALELLQGIRSKKEEKLLRSYFQYLEKRTMLNFGMLEEYAKMFRLLKSKGLTIRKTNDVIIAGFCILNGYPLLQKDRDFTPFEKYLALELL